MFKCYIKNRIVTRPCHKSPNRHFWVNIVNHQVSEPMSRPLAETRDKLPIRGNKCLKEKH